MSVYDKELIIDGKAVRSPEQQVYKNMKDIESLQDTIKPEYKCTVELNTSATSVAKSNTNAGTDVKSGWLLDPKGKKFKITGGDDDNLLIDFYTSYQGPQGESGVSAIDDESTSATKVWSSQKVNNSLDKGIFTTMVEPTDLGGGLEYRLDYEDAPILTSGIHVRVNDLIIYIDGDDKAKSIYSVSAVYDEYVYLAKQGDFGGEKTYIHNIYAEGTYSSSYGQVRISITIENNDATPFTYDTLRQYLYNKGFTNGSKFYTNVSGITYNTNVWLTAVGIFATSLTGNIDCRGLNQQTQSNDSLRENTMNSFIDTVCEK